VQERSREGNRVQGVLERAHLQLASVASDLRGVLGWAMWAAWIDGRADPAPRAAWAKGCWRCQIPVLAPALTGLGRDHHWRVLARPWALMDCREAPLEPLHADITPLRTALSGVPPAAGGTPEGHRPTAPAPPDPSMTLAHAVSKLDTSPGVEQRGGAQLVAEWGMALTRLGTAARLAAWSGVAPGHEARAGTPRAGKTRTGNRALRTGLTPLAYAAALTMGTSVSALEHRLAARWGKHRAIRAVAPSIVVRAFHRR
jgi:transposase